MISNVNTDGSAVSMAHVQQIAPVGILTPSDSEPGLWYDVTPEHCPCKSFQFGHVRDPQFRCKHQIRHYGQVPATPRYKVCEYCHIEPARQAGCYCSDRCADLGAAQSIYTGVDEADYVEDTAPAIGPVDDPIYQETASVPGVLALHDAERARRTGDTPFVDEMRRLSAERHAKALAAPVGTFTLISSGPYGDLFD